MARSERLGVAYAFDQANLRLEGTKRIRLVF